MKLPFLKFIHSGLLTGMPSLIYNPYSKTSFNIPLTISENSIYLNFRLSPQFSDYLDNYVRNYSDSLSIVPVCLFPEEEATKYLSINIYNCSSPAFLNRNKETLRCELNTYVKDEKTGKYGTLILDYLSSGLSMDPINIFKLPPPRSDGALFYNIIHQDPCNPQVPTNISIDCRSTKDKINLNLKLCVNKLKEASVLTSKDLVKFSDYIYYKNGIYDKLFYDDSLVNARIKSPFFDVNVDIDDDSNSFFFVYKDLFFKKIDSIFYFENQINFVGSIWENIDYE
jgi:hypothetical protein